MAIGLYHLNGPTGGIRGHEHSTVQPQKFPGLPTRFHCIAKFQGSHHCRRPRPAKKLRCSQDPDPTSSRKKTEQSNICECLLLVQARMHWSGFSCSTVQARGNSINSLRIVCRRQTLREVACAFQVAHDVSAEEAEETVGRLWSAQYRAAGTLCAFGGAQLANTVGSLAISSQYTHAVRFRFGSQAVRSSVVCSL